MMIQKYHFTKITQPYVSIVETICCFCFTVFKMPLAMSGTNTFKCLRLYTTMDSIKLIGTAGVEGLKQ